MTLEQSHQPAACSVGRGPHGERYFIPSTKEGGWMHYKVHLHIRKGTGAGSSGTTQPSQRTPGCLWPGCAGAERPELCCSGEEPWQWGKASHAVMQPGYGVSRSLQRKLS